MPRVRVSAVILAGASMVGAAVLIFFGGPASAAGTPLPTHVFAPYFESWTGENPATLSQQSGAKYLTMAFLQTAQVGSCTAFWNGDSGMPIASTTFGNEINTIRANGGDVVPSFGGFTADDGGTEIADSCTDVSQIAQVFQKVISTYNVTRIDLDTEANSLTNNAGIDRRNKAIKMTEDWAAANGRTIQFVYTLPTSTTGLVDTGLNVLRNAVQNNARVDIVNMMTFDYFDNQSHQMFNDTKTAANGLHSQLQQLYPTRSSAEIWGMIGVTEMIGIDDFGPGETFTVADGTNTVNWAKSQGIAELSFWALQRDNGGCPGTQGSDSCSGIQQSTWQFSQMFASFTSGTNPSGSPSQSRSASASPSASRSPSASPSTPPSSPPAGNGLVNGNFETGALVPWTCTGGNGSVVSSPAHSGSHALRASPTSADTAECAQSVTLQANHTYTLSAWVQGNYAFIGTTGAATNGSNWTSSPTYTKLSTTFTTGASGTAQVFIHGWYGQNPIFVDDVTVS